MQARFCDQRATATVSTEERKLFIHLRNSWISVANELQFTEGVRARRRTPRARPAQLA
jgi:hypothetical protein